MRRALLEQLPAFSYVFGVHPWDVDRLTFREVRRYQHFLDLYIAARAPRRR